jgi:flagellar hook-associated protein 1 FlgK
MSSLFGSLSIALRALLAQQGGLEVTSNNIANVNTPGFSRQRAVLRQDPPVLFGDMQLGTGVRLDQVLSIRDRILELRIHQERQQEADREAFLGAARQIEALFNEAQGAGLGDALTAFFNSLTQLSANPTSIPLRQGVLTAATNLANAFRKVARDLATLQGNLDRSVVQSAGEINELTAEIAELNKEVSARVGIGVDPGEFADRRELLIRELAARVDISVIDAGKGSVTITTSGGAALVVADRNIPVQALVNPLTGRNNIFSQGSDITATITSGALSGLLEARDRLIPGLLADLDTLAADVSTSFNAQHRLGFDLNGAAGVDFFAPVAGSGAASGFAVAITDPRLLAGSSDGAPGSSGNLTALAALRDLAIVAGQKPADFYSNVVFRLGNSIANAEAELEGQALVLRQLENQRGAVSAVSLDEEAANLLRFQRAFEAAARVVAVVDEMTGVAINLGRS